MIYTNEAGDKFESVDSVDRGIIIRPVEEKKQEYFIKFRTIAFRGGDLFYQRFDDLTPAQAKAVADAVSEVIAYITSGDTHDFIGEVNKAHTALKGKV